MNDAFDALTRLRTRLISRVKYRRRSLILVVMLEFAQFLLPSHGFADFPSEAEKAFNDAASLHKGEFESLMKMRGLPGPGERAATLGNVVKKLPPGAVLLFYHHDGTELSVWALGDHGIEWKTIQISKDRLQGLIEGYRKSIGSMGNQVERAPIPRGLTRVRDSAIRSTSNSEISQVLFHGEIEPLVAGAKHLLIVPCLGIGSVPFSSLKLSESEAPIANSASITLLPSLYDSDVALRPLHDLNGDRLAALVVGNPKFERDPGWVLPQLPGSEKEAKSVSSMFPSTLLLGKNATKRKVTATIESADIIYFATHGISSQANPLDESFLALAGSGPEQCRLTAREIQNMNLRARLVVLSACQTGLGGLHDAGIIGLARAFKIAGAEEVVASLWAVDDNVTAEFMTEFMNRYINTGLRSAADSLSETVKVIRVRHPNPAHWAPFVVINGKGSIGRSDK